MAYQTLIDGRPADAVPAADRGLQYGDGLFETIAVFAGHPCLWQAHMDRLHDGCVRLGLPAPDTDALRREADQLIGDVQQAVLKIQVTRGEGGRGYRPPREPSPRRILALHPWPDHPAGYRSEGIRLRWCETRLGSNPQLAGIKHCNRLEQVLARAEWDDPAIPEGLMCDGQNRVVEATMSNLFLIHDGRLVTPLLDQCGVAGVARARVLAIAADLGMPCDQARVSREQVLAADALLLTNALIGIWPVATLDGHAYDSGHWPAELIARTMEQVYQP